MPGKAFRIKRQTSEGETLHAPTYNACRCCYKPIPDEKHVHYCSDQCQETHHRLHGAA